MDKPSSESAAMVAKDPFDLQRFLDAQHGIFERSLDELRQGRKRGHWMWFVFPQISGLGHSPMAVTYAIASLAEAKAYLQQPILGVRLVECTQAAMSVENRSLLDIFGSPDDLKFRSSMTLFARASVDEPIFMSALRKYCRSELDPATLERL
jgi:uncharacterized protein (DUF1810 family)